MSENTKYVPPQVSTIDASQVVASLGPASAGSHKSGKTWTGSTGFGMG